MKYPYYNPNLTFPVLFNALFKSSAIAEQEIKNYFHQLTGKKYILITNSCRTALYLTYKTIEEQGEVITSPLTCKVAIDPVTESGLKPVFADIKTEDLIINPDDIEHRITKKTKAIQAIHLGGVSCNMNNINGIAQKNNLWVIEDCAQSLGATYDGKNTGSFGDIACFSLIKNAFGIGGGILATDNKEIYDKTLALNSEFKIVGIPLTFFRIIRNVTETYRKSFIGNIVHKVLMSLKGKRSSYTSVRGQLKKTSPWQLKISAIQISRLPKLHQKRKSIGKLYYNKLKETGFLINSNYDPNNSSFTKFFLYNPKIETKKDLKYFHDLGIEAMHLEHKQGSPYQEMLISNKEATAENLIRYQKVHDSVISIPLDENFSTEDLQFILERIQK